MKNFLLILIFIIAATITNAQTYQWALSAGSTNSDYGIAIAVDGLGNSYVTGGFRNTADFDPSPGVANLTSAGGDDIFVANYNSIGTYQWAFRIGGAGIDQGRDIAVDGFGNIYITGRFWNTVDFDPGPGTANLTASGMDIYVAKYNSSGAYQWAFNVGSTGDEEGYSIAVDGTGNVYVTGYFWFTADFDPSAGTSNLTANGMDLFVAKYSTSGIYQWAFNIGGTGDDIGYQITSDGSGNVYVTGNFVGTADFNPGAGIANLTSVGGDDVFVAKYNTSGVYQWAFNIGGNSTDQGWGVALDGLGYLFITGDFLGTADFDPGPGTANLTSSGSYDIYVAKYNISGAYQWAFNIGCPSPDWGLANAVDGSGNVYITGQFQSTVDFDPGIGTANLTPVGSADAYVAKYNSSGSYQWAFDIGSAGFVRGNGLATDGSCNIYVTGQMELTADFDPGSGTANHTSVGSDDIFVAKYSDCPPPIIADFSASDSTICAGSCINFADSSTGSPPTSWNWSFPGSSTPTSILQNPSNICYANAGTYPVTLIVTNLTSADTISHNILVSPLPVISSIAVSDTVCNGSCTNITASGAATYTWMPGSLTGATVNVCPTATTIFTVVGTSLAGCIDSSTIEITVVANPTVTATAVSDTICSGSCTDLTASGALTYTWMPGGLTGTTVNVCPTTTTIYTVVGSLMAGCVDSSTIQITVHQTPTVTASAVSDTLCAGSCTDLSASGAATYIWLPGSLTGTTINVCPTSTTTYSVTGTTIGCSDSGTVTVIVNPLPIAAIVGDANICLGQTATLTASGGTFYDWNTAVITPTIIVSPSSTYTYTVTVTSNGCTDTESFTVNVFSLPIANAGNDTTISIGDSAQLNGSGGVTYAWSPSNGLSCTNCVNPIASPTDTTTYILTVTDANGCTDVDTVVVNVIKEIVDCGEVFVPNAFSPNNDGINDTLFVRGKCISKMEFCIYNRWGEKVFESNNINTGWNGKYKNGTRNTGVYVWYLIATLNDGTLVNKKGNVTLFR